MPALWVRFPCVWLQPQYRGRLRLFSGCRRGTHRKHVCCNHWSMWCGNRSDCCHCSRAVYERTPCVSNRVSPATGDACCVHSRSAVAAFCLGHRPAEEQVLAQRIGSRQRRFKNNDQQEHNTGRRSSGGDRILKDFVSFVSFCSIARIHFRQPLSCCIATGLVDVLYECNFVFNSSL